MFSLSPSLPLTLSPTLPSSPALPKGLRIGVHIISQATRICYVASLRGQLLQKDFMASFIPAEEMLETVQGVRARDRIVLLPGLP